MGFVKHAAASAAPAAGYGDFLIRFYLKLQNAINLVGIALAV